MEEKKTKVINVRISETMLEQIEEIASETGNTIPDMVRMLITWGIKEFKEDTQS